MENESKFNFSEENEKEVQETKKAVKEGAKGLFGSTKQFLVELLSFKKDTDRDSTIEAIKGDIPFKGATAWILVCSIFVASVGLNANSTAVVIGAMLISPLMGPILGIGMSIAINDIDTLKRSLINFAVMVVLSVLTAFLFFWLFPLKEDSSELLARTKPDIRDVLIAFFGGLALIIARTKKGTIASVIFGVAIATALMPPLCTVGFGLAKALLGEAEGLQFALGAIYLFAINTIFIALATFIVLKLLRFPMIKYANSAKRKRIARFASFVAILVMIPAGFTFYNVLKESRFEGDAKKFIEAEFNGLQNAGYVKKNTTYTYRSDGTSVIELPSLSQEQLPDAAVNLLKARMHSGTYSALADATLNIDRAGENNIENQIGYIKELRTKDSIDLLSKNQKILFLEQQVSRLSELEKGQIPFKEISDEAKINYEYLAELAYSNTIKTNFTKIDTVPVFSIKWKDTATAADIEKQQKKLEAWLKLKMGNRKFQLEKAD